MQKLQVLQKDSVWRTEKFMKICFVSNYINHHQIPFCNAMCKETEGQFFFIQTEPMELERVQMGWQEQERPEYVHRYYEEEDWCRRMIQECDVVLFGGCDDERYIEERLKSGKMVIRISERLYKTGQWKAVSPRGLVKKYKDHTRYRKAPVYLLCAGAYVASDFQIVRAYPGKKFCWGYFPETKEYDVETLMQNKGYVCQDGTRIPYIVWAARMIALKHPERALAAAKYLKQKGLKFRLDMIGGGVLEEDVKAQITAEGLEDCVFVTGFQTPDRVRQMMEKADIFLFTSNRQEGWGAVVNESMNSGCALVSGNMPGSVPYLVRQGYNGYMYQDGDQQMLNAIMERLVRDPKQCETLGRRAYRTITGTWNAENAAASLMQLIRRLQGKSGTGDDATYRGCANELVPCAPAPLISEYRKVRTAEFVPEESIS
ncbi:MAG: glycosyltransferase [Lachnospiraceae bacterium]|nr:glycosyltransferase [Lachnospiraceae bacterium]